MMRSINRLNEEIARWAFEILFKSDSEWTIAFTNPTAGPWKTIKACSLLSGKEGEVYRFPLEEDRPDIIMYNDALKCVLIFEAKDSLEKLMDYSQAKKSADVVIKLADILSNSKDNLYWKGRENYKVLLGLLWGCNDSRESTLKKDDLYNVYQNLVVNHKEVCHSLVIGVETLYRNEKLKCEAYFKTYNEDSSLGERIIKSLIK